MHHEIGVIEGLTWLCHTASLWAAVQMWENLEIAIELFNLLEKLMDWYSVGHLQDDVVLHQSPCIIPEDALQVKVNVVEK